MRQWGSLDETYYKGVGLYPLLSRDDEVKLAKTIEQGVKAERILRRLLRRSRRLSRRKLALLVAKAKKARQVFVNANLKLVISEACRLDVAGVELTEIIGQGNLVLVKTVDRIGWPNGFDWRRGIKFSTFLVRNLRWSLGRDAYRSSHIGFGKTKRKRFLLFSEFDSPEKQSERCLVESLVEDNHPADNQDGLELNQQIGRLLKNLDERSRLIIELRFGLNGAGHPRTLQEIGQRFKITRERVRQIEKKAFRRLKAIALEEDF